MPALAPSLLNPATGDHLTVFSSPLSGDPGPFVFVSDLAPNAAGSPLHRHRILTETFEVLDGEIDFRIGNVSERLAPGAIRHVPPGRLHAFRNPTDRPARLRGTVSPGGDFEAFMRIMSGLAIDGRTDKAGMPRDPRLLAIAVRHADLIFPVVPAPVQRIAVSMLAGLARLTGADRTLHPYWRV